MTRPPVTRPPSPMLAAEELALHMSAGIRRDLAATFMGRNVDEARFAAVGRRPEIGAAGDIRADAACQLVLHGFGRLRVELDILGGVVFERLAGLRIDAFGPS